jgi:5-formyltetrahydrofolate cyclo-ligase
MTNGRRGSAHSIDLPVIRQERSGRGDALGRSAAKKRLRQEAKARRAALSQHERTAAAQAMAERAMSALTLPEGAVISGYVPVGEEADAMPLLTRLAERGNDLALPAVLDRGRPLAFRAWAPGAALVPGWYGIPCPHDSAPERRPTIVLLPLLAFDRRGHRLGHGAGFYDRSLAALRAEGPVLAVGLAFAVQELAHVPAEAHDQPLDWIVTERDAVFFAGDTPPATEAG